MNCTVFLQVDLLVHVYTCTSHAHVYLNVCTPRKKPPPPKRKKTTTQKRLEFLIIFISKLSASKPLNVLNLYSCKHFMLDNQYMYKHVHVLCSYKAYADTRQPCTLMTLTRASHTLYRLFLPLLFPYLTFLTPPNTHTHTTPVPLATTAGLT